MVTMVTAYILHNGIQGLTGNRGVAGIDGIAGRPVRLLLP